VERAKRPGPRRFTEEVRRCAEEKLRLGWSPEANCGRAELAGVNSLALPPLRSLALAVRTVTRYTVYMSAFLIQQPKGPAKSFLRAFAILAAALVCGCASLSFKPYRQTRFVNMDAEVILAEYAKEKRTETLPNGLVSTFENKVRLTLPDGKRITLYQSFSPFGVCYVSKNGRYEFIERGVYCLFYKDGQVAFEGVHCRN